MFVCQADAHPRGDTHVLRLAGEVDIANSEALVATALLAVGSGQVTTLIVDLSEVDFFDSAALGALVRIRNGAQAQGCEVRVQGARRHVAKLFTITSLDAVFLVDAGHHA
jgi:anti-sigma B factor antagonist